MRPSTSFKGIYLFLCGLCMGAADLVPGISGGTIAFIMGFYTDLLESLKSFNVSSLQLLGTFQFRAFSQKAAWPFLLTLMGGIATSFFFLAGFLHWILEHELYRVYLYSAFLGLILSSFVLCMRELKKWTPYEMGGLILGAVAAYLLTGATMSSDEPGLYAIQIENTSNTVIRNYNAEKGLLVGLKTDTLNALLAKNDIQPETKIYTHEGILLGNASEFTSPYHSSLMDGWLIFCGSIAICALLLPGISGSYLLTLLGVYPKAIGALADLTANLKRGVVDWDAAIILFNLLIGIIIGALVFSRVASWLLRKYPTMSIAILCGFMIGALRSVWPFWSYSYELLPLKLHKGAQLIPLEPIWPSFASWSFVLAVTSTLIGFGFVMLIDWAAKQKKAERTKRVI